MKFLAWSSGILTALASLSFLTNADTAVDHGEAQVEWLRAQGGFFHPGLNIEKDPKFGHYAMFATSKIAAKTKLIQLPRSSLVTSGGSYETCDTARNVAKMMLDPSNENPYIEYLKSQPEGQLPSSWSPQGQYLLNKMIGENLGPADATDYDFHKDCGPSDLSNIQHAYLLVLQRGWDDLLLPVYDMMSHRNGKYLNTECNPVHEDDDIVVSASRDIEAGEELYTSYNFCVDCGARSHNYGTPEIVRDYGFVEIFPQRWIFDEVSNFAFDLPTEDSDVQWIFPNPPSAVESLNFLQREMERLKNMDLSKDGVNVPQNELKIIKNYHAALLLAMTKAKMEISNSQQQCPAGSNEPHCVGDGASSANPPPPPPKPQSWYDGLQEKKDTLAYNLYTCEFGRNMDFPEYDRQDRVQSLYQAIEFYTHPETKDTCFELDNIVQICGSYRPHYHEMVVHHTARYIDTVKRVVFVGGGDSMLLHEILKYPSLELVVGLEIDQQVTRLSFKHFGSQPHWDQHEKVQWWYGDASKSLLMLPHDYFGSFDMVLVDLSETVMSMSVTDGLDIFGALALLLTPDGIIVKNELYFDKFSDIFKYTSHVHYYDIPVICSQALVYGSYQNDMLRKKPKQHDFLSDNVYMHHVDEVEPYAEWHDYRRNSTGSQKHCMEPGESNQVVVNDNKSPGILMILEADAVGVDFEDGNIQKVLEASLTKDLGLELVSTAVHEAAMTIVTTDGYVTARSWPIQKYVALDIHLWNNFDSHEAIKKTLLAALKSSESSAYRIVAGGMHGLGAKKDKIGPILTQECDAADETERMNDSPNSVKEAAMDTMIKEGLSSLVDDEKIVVGVVCGQLLSDCPSINAVKSMGDEADLIVIPTCAQLHPQQNEDAQLHPCELTTYHALVATGKKLRAIIVDSNTPFAMAQIIHRMFTFQDVREKLLAKDLTMISTSANVDQSVWRRAFLDRFRHDFIINEPVFVSEVLFNSTDSSIQMAAMSSGDQDFLKHLMNAVDNIEKQTDLVSDVRNVQGGMFKFMKDFVPSQFFPPSAYNRTDPMAQYQSQMPLGVQSVVQMEVQWKPSLIVGDRIEGNWEGKGDWFPGTIMAVHLDGTFDISFDDGDNESNVIRQFIRKLHKSESDQQPDDAVLNLTPSKVKSAFEKVLFTAGVDAKVHDFELSVGEGCVLAALWSGGSIVVLSNGRLHMDLNVFVHGDDRGFARDLADMFGKEIEHLWTALRDEQPRGYGRVVNFASDLSVPRKMPHWTEPSTLDDVKY